MESQIKASFIPQDVGTEPKLRRGGTSGGSDLLVLAAIILLVASIALAASVFLYAQYLQGTITSKQASIDRARAAIEPALIDELARLDARMASAATLLGQHVAPSVVFDLLEQITLHSIALTDFSLTTEGVNSLKISMKGEAQSVNSIALQSDLYGRSGIITSPIFSDINRGTDGLMQFRVDAILNPTALRYARLVENAAAAGSATTNANTSTGTIQSQSGTQAQQTQTQGNATSQPAGATTTSSKSGAPAFTPVHQ